MRRRRREKCPVAISIMLIVVGVIMGTIFVFGAKYWGKEIQRKDFTYYIKEMIKNYSAYIEKALQ